MITVFTDYGNFEFDATSVRVSEERLVVTKAGSEVALFNAGAWLHAEKGEE